MVAGEGLFAASGSPCGPRCARCLTAFDPNLQSKLLILLQVLLTGFIDWLEEDCSMKWWRESRQGYEAQKIQAQNGFRWWREKDSNLRSR